MGLPNPPVTSTDRPLKDIPQKELEKRHDELKTLAEEITRAYLCLIKAIDAAVDTVILSLPRDLWKYFKAGDAEKAFDSPPENMAVFDDLDKVEAELKKRRRDAEAGIATASAAGVA